jgi:hypothetical protein
VTSTTSERLREAVSDTLGYGEPRRVVYNLVLVLIVFVLAVLANVCYCAAYLADVFVQVSGFREAWQKWRFILFVIGLAFAAVITPWFVLGFFTSPRVG